jgi:hypothetical protein
MRMTLHENSTAIGALAGPAGYSCASDRKCPGIVVLAQLDAGPLRGTRGTPLLPLEGLRYA